MANKTEGKPSFFDKIKYKYRLSIYRDETYEEVLNLKLSRLNFFAVIGTLTLIFLAIVVSIIAYTPVREFIPGYPDENTLRTIHLNAIRTDSLIMEIERRDRYFDNMKLIIAGKEPNNYENSQDSNISYENINFNRSTEDSLIRQIFEEDSEFSLSVVNARTKIGSISQLHFFPPVKGLVTNSFNTSENHYGTDIVSGANEVVKSTLEGTVTMATWTLETGHVIQVQHGNNIISIYKHNAELLKRVGDYVKAGEPIAIIGNSGELTTGPHLHLELWYNGVPLNPEDYISF
ncbi:MAG: M23 family metallopeptidase [Bacteroidales bacterium]|nr:M23 family metallopeptidase [Bacteroidales bacterium]MBN2817575.1 M23 family metallopeptidase [Bacteroidales bacterium]